MKQKQILAILTAAVLTAGGVLAGCGGGSTADQSAEASASASSGAEADGSESDSMSGDSEAATVYDEGEDTDEIDPEQAAEEARLEGIPVTEDADAPVEDCVQLGEYKGLKLTKRVTELTDEDVASYANANAETTELSDPDATVETGDTVNIAYVGEKDGVAFEGGTDDDAELEIGSGMFIPGFEDGVIGMKVGETKDLDLTFPENYGSEELAGADVVFHVTVNAINRPAEVTDADLAAARAELEADYDAEAVQLMQTEAWQMVKDNSEFLQLRQSDIDRRSEDARHQLDEWIENLEVTFEEYLEMQGISEEEFERNIGLYAREAACEDLLIEALAKEEGLSADDQEQQDKLAELAEEAGQTADELIEEYGEDTIYQYIMTERLVNRIISYADVTEETITADNAFDLEDYDFIDESDEVSAESGADE